MMFLSTLTLVIWDFGRSVGNCRAAFTLEQRASGSGCIFEITLVEGSGTDEIVSERFKRVHLFSWVLLQDILERERV
jgi:hypothetical protein